MSRRLTTVEERFWMKVNQDGANWCWLWTGNTTHNGYGQFTVDGRTRRAHRYAYQLLVGPIDVDKELDHLCRVRPCVNPAHLEMVTRQVNQLRGEGVGAIAARRTHCPQGHPYDLFNTRIIYNGRRRCRECQREQQYQRRSACKAGT